MTTPNTEIDHTCPPIDRIREAARLMREQAEKATSGPWEFRPRRGFESLRDNPATIGFTDTAGYFVMLREGTWTTENDMGYIASWHPAVALGVARWLEFEVRCTERAAQQFPSDIWDVDEHALAVADAYLGDALTTPASTTSHEAEGKQIAAMLNEYGAAMRGDWGSIDGRGVRSDLGDIASWITSRPYPGDEKARERLGLCPAGWGHWSDHCDEDGCEPLTPPVSTGGDQS